jgi:hypothetical protein
MGIFHRVNIKGVNGQNVGKKIIKADILSKPESRVI